MTETTPRVTLEELWGPKEQWTLPWHLHRRATESPTRPFLQVVGEERVTFADSAQRAAVMAARLRALGVSAGDTVVLMAPTSMDMIHLWFGANLLSAAEVPINTAYRGRSLSHAINLSEARVMVSVRDYLPRILEVADDLRHLDTVVCLDGAPSTPPADVPAHLSVRGLQDVPAGDDLDDVGSPSYRDTASIIYTSGTTGPAKGVVIPHAQMHTFAQVVLDALAIREDDEFYCFHSMVHSTKFTAINSALIRGSRVTVDTAFDPTTWIARVREVGATVSVAHGPMIEMILNQPEQEDDRDNPLRIVLGGGVPVQLGREFEERFGLRVLEGYGMTEAYMVLRQPLDAPTPPGSCGQPVDELFEVALVDPDTDEPVAENEVGEITLRPRERWIMMQGYRGMPDKTVEAWHNLWFHTGDLARMDAERFVYFVERAADRIRRRAENVSSFEIEEAARQHPRVLEVAAVGVPSEFELDDDIKLCVVPAGDEPFPHAQLIEHLVPRLPHYMVPRYLELVDELPRSITNKVQKKLLRDRGATPDEVWDREAAGVSVREITERGASPGAG